MEWSPTLEWQKYLLFVHKIVYSMEWSLEVEYWIGVESNFRVAKKYLLFACILVQL